jgi:KDO2-lipid IV(A) lauroyltransferase
MKLLKETGTYLAYSAMWRLVRWLPESVAYRTFEAFGRRFYKRNGKRIERIRENYRKVSPEVSDAELELLVQQGIASSMRYWCDTFRISDWSKERTAQTVTTERAELLLGSLAKGGGLVIALPHAGNWDHAGLYFCAQGIRVNTVAEHLRPERLFQRFIKHREAMGMRIFDIKARVTSHLIDVIKSGELVALPADRDLSASGIDVEFFGANARMPAGPALLALRTGAPLITAYVGFRKNGIHIKFAGPFTSEVPGDERARIVDLTQQLADQFAHDIFSDLTSWHMMQRIFIPAAS